MLTNLGTLMFTTVPWLYHIYIWMYIIPAIHLNFSKFSVLVNAEINVPASKSLLLLLLMYLEVNFCIWTCWVKDCGHFKLFGACFQIPLQKGWGTWIAVWPLDAHFPWRPQVHAQQSKQDCVAAHTAGNSPSLERTHPLAVSQGQLFSVASSVTLTLLVGVSVDSYEILPLLQVLFWTTPYVMSSS